MQAEFVTKLMQVQAETNSRIILNITPQVMRMPLPIRRYDDPFFPFGRALIDATRDLVCGYMFDLASYLAIGAAGAIALERTISYAIGERLMILHGPFTGGDYMRLTDENAFGVDAITITSQPNISAYLSRSDRSVFVIAPELADDMPALYWPAESRMQVRGVDASSLGVVGEEAIYAASDDNWTDAVREVLRAKPGR